MGLVAAPSTRSRAQSPPAGAVAAGWGLLRSAARFGRWLAARSRRAIRNRLLPGEIRAQLGLRRGERVLAVGYGPAGGYALIATSRALHHHAPGGGWSRLGWEQVAAARWNRPARCLVITGLPGIAPPRTVLPLADCGALPALAEERITHTRLGLWKVLLDGGRRVRVEVRRRPLTDELVWAAADGDADTSDQTVRKQISEAVDGLGEYLGVRCSPGPGRDLRFPAPVS